MKIKKLYWSPSAFWILENGTLFINETAYPDEIKALFPEFYFLTLKGITITKLLQHYQGSDGNTLTMLIQKLQQENVLVHSIDNVTALFHAQDRIYQDIDNSGIKVKASPEERKKFTDSALTRVISDTPFPVRLKDVSAGKLLDRHSVRTFDTETVIPFAVFSELLSVLKDYGTNGQHHYLYPSGGGLYPVDVYIFIKENRVEGLSQGLYHFSASENVLRMLSLPDIHFKEAHYFANREIHEQSAFSVYFVYHAGYSMPKYDGLGYYLGIVDSGIMSQALTVKAFECGLGSCIIGEMDFDKIAEYFHLNSMQKYLHCMEFGIEKGNC